MNVLEYIYRGEYEPCKPLEEMPLELYTKQKEFFDAVEHTMGLAFIERHWEDLEAVRKHCDFHYFREGFRLGMALMREVHDPV